MVQPSGKGVCVISEAKARLLDAVVDHVAANGVGGLGLRPLAAAIGTSHRMLIYHFGSKEGLLVEVIRTVEARQRAALAELERAAGGAPAGAMPAEVMRAFWARLADPALWPLERLFFEVYGQALQGRPGTTGLLDGVIDDWVEPMTASAVRAGVPEGRARADARLALAVGRGLLLDLLATGDRPGVDAAFERYVEGWAATQGSGSDSASPARSGSSPRAPSRRGRSARPAPAPGPS